MPTEFIWPIRVYYEDTDAGGVVYYANYLKFFERARTEWLNALGIDQVQLLQANVAFAVRKAEVDYLKPAVLNDQLTIVSRITQVKGVSVVFEQQLYPSNDSQRVLCQANIKVVCLTLNSFTPCPIPTVVREELQRVS